MLTVRASTGGQFSDVAVTVNVTNVDEAPAFAETSYAFALEENADGSETGVALGTVSAADPEGLAPTYSIVGGTESERFEIDAATGALSYIGTGEDYESGTTSYVLTVRASTGGQFSDVAVTVNVTNVDEAPAFAETSYAFALEENADGSETGVALGTVSAADPEGLAPTYSIVGGTESERFEIDAATGALSYIGTGEDYESGTTSYVLTVRASTGGQFSDVAVTVNVTNVDEAPAFAETSYAFALEENADGSETGVALGTVSAADPEGLAPAYSIVGGTESARFEIDAATGALSYIGTGEDYESGTTSYVLTVRASAGGQFSDVAVTVNVTNVDEAPAFAETSYAFALEENADGSETGVALGTVSAADPEGLAPAYSIVGGTESARFEIDAATGALSYIGTGEDYESGTTSYVLTVRASAGGQFSDVAVTVNVTNVDEAPAFAETSYAFALEENADGSETGVALGTVSAADPEGLAPAYSIVGGTESERFEIDAATGALSYIGTGEDYESGTTSHVLTVRASTGGQFSDVAVTVNVTDVDEPLVTVSEGDTDLPAGVDTAGRVMVGESASGEIQSRGDRDWFAVELAAETTYLFALEGSGTDPGTLSEPYLAGIHDSEGNRVDGTSGNNPGEGRNARVSFTAPADGTYYVSAGADGDRQGSYRLTVTRATSSIRVSDTEAHEEDGVLVFLVVLDEASAQPVTVRYATADGTAVAGVDYEPAFGELEFARGETEKRVEVALIDDNVEDNGETFVLRLGNAMGAVLADSEGTGTIRNTDPVSEGATDFPADTSTSGRVVVGQSVTGTIDRQQEKDWFAVDLEAGKTYRFDLEGSPWTLRNPYLYGIHDSNGNLIPGTTDELSGVGWNGAMVTFTPENAGTYYVSAGSGHQAILSWLYYTGSYRLSVTDVSGADTLTAGTDTTGTVSVDGTATGVIDYRDDQDWFAVDLEAGKTYWFDLEGSWTGRGTLKDPHLRGIHDSDGNLIAGTTDDNGGERRNAWLYFTAEETGTYYVSAGATGGRWGTYRLAVTDITDKYMQTPETATTGSVAVGESVTGNINHAGDRDWYTVTLEANTIYRVLMEGSDTDGGTLGDPYLHGVYDSDVSLIDGTTNDNGERWRGLNSWVFVTPSADGTYYVSAGGRRSHTGTYELSVRNASAADVQTAGIDTSGSVGVNRSVRGETDYPHEQDWYAVELEADVIYRFDLEGAWTRAGTLTDPYLRGIYDSAGNLIPGTAVNHGGLEWNSRLAFAPSEDGTYYVAAGAAGSRTGTYKLTVTSDTHAAGTNTTGQVSVGGSVSGDIDWIWDRDWFAVTLQADIFYRIDLKAARNGVGTLYDPKLYGIHDSNGNLIAGTTDDNSGDGLESRVYFTPSADGTYYVSAGSESPNLYGDPVTGTYRLSVTNISAADAQTAGTDTSGSVAVGGFVRGEVHYPGDRDWFAVELEAGTVYRIDLEGLSTGVGSLYDPHLYGIYDSDGNLIPGTTNDDGGKLWNSRLTFTSSAAGTYYVSAGSSAPPQPNHKPHYEGTYKLTVMKLSVADPQTAGTDTSGSVTVGGLVTGALDYPGDRDWFAVTLEDGTTYRIDLKGASDGGLPDPYLHGIHDAEGDLIPGTTNDDGGYGLNSRLTFTPSADGTYYVSAGAFGGYTGTYTLSVEEL